MTTRTKTMMTRQSGSVSLRKAALSRGNLNCVYVNLVGPGSRSTATVTQLRYTGNTGSTQPRPQGHPRGTLDKWPWYRLM